MQLSPIGLKIERVLAFVQFQAVSAVRSRYSSVPLFSDYCNMNNCFYCGQEDCSEKCNDCHNVYYCCQEHLAFHRSQDSKCFPFRVEKNQELGRYMVATADIKPFQTVLQDQALAFGPSEFNPACCLICLQSLEDVSHVCPQCNVPLCKSEVKNVYEKV